ncbi:MAG: hypothetical protein WBA57_15760 [Elainellaceae cyanobacterium]
MLALNSTTSQPHAAHVEQTSASTAQPWIQQISLRISPKISGFSNPISHIEYLRSLPRESFGQSWAAFLDASLIPTATGTRRTQIQDGVHVLTGYGTDPLGKAEVQAFLLGTRFRWIHRSLAIALLHLLVLQIRNTENSSTALSASLGQRLLDAYSRGQQSVINVKTWQPEMLLDLPLPIVRRWFRV